mmetsp:Transcript_53078/g.119104  ORF Transcript_53078/g.119104 Transcript_53078/m.119104 type:complete len:138 (-) Transcript_53078:161-574(-)
MQSLLHASPTCTLRWYPVPSVALYSHSLANTGPRCATTGGIHQQHAPQSREVPPQSRDCRMTPAPSLEALEQPGVGGLDKTPRSKHDRADCQVNSEAIRGEEIDWRGGDWHEAVLRKKHAAEVCRHAEGDERGKELL